MINVITTTDNNIKFRCCIFISTVIHTSASTVLTCPHMWHLQQQNEVIHRVVPRVQVVIRTEPDRGVKLHFLVDARVPQQMKQDSLWHALRAEVFHLWNRAGGAWFEITSINQHITSTNHPAIDPRDRGCPLKVEACWDKLLYLFIQGLNFSEGLRIILWFP